MENISIDSESSEEEINKNLIEENDKTIVKWPDYYNYRFAEYYLKTALKTPISIKAIHNVKSEEDLARIEEAEKNILWTYGWYNLNQDDYPKCIGRLKTKGFIEKSDGDFEVGSINYNPNDKQSSYYLLCKLFIGYSLCAKKDRDKEDNIKKGNIPPYFNSIKLLDRKKYNDSKDLLVFSYKILKPNYIYPLYVIKFDKMDEKDSKKENKHYCSKCEEKEAEKFCFNCEDYFDKDCYEKKHEKVKHEGCQELIYGRKEGKCSEHKKYEAEYYCLTCKKPICSKCKIKINKIPSIHSSHKVKDIYTAFEDELTYTYLVKEIRKRAEKRLKEIKKTVKELLEKQIMIEKEIDHEFREENDSIQSLTKEAKLKHFSVSAELSEMKKHLEHINKYYKNCQKAMICANLRPEAVWIKDNYEEVVNDIFSNFENINPTYKVKIDSFNKIKQTELRITKKISMKKQIEDYISEVDILSDKLIKIDDQYSLNKKIVSLKKEKEETKKKKQKDQQDKERKNFDSATIENKYALNETPVIKQKAIAEQEVESQKEEIKTKNMEQEKISNSNEKLNE